MKNWIALTGFAALLVLGCAARHSFEGAGNGPGTQTLSGKDMGRTENQSAAKPPSAGPDADSNQEPDAAPDYPGVTPVPEDPSDSKPEFILPHNQHEPLTI